ncbi:MAG: exodeoxyribonuclease III [Pseudobdellovibrio sp.]|nr:exodeoxyribonuclease III [Pseudobdellovibrio sp.]
MNQRIVTWNVNGVRACYEKTLPDFIEKNKPDILCLQETKAHIDQVEPEIRTLGYKNSYWSSAERKGYSGVATFMNQNPINVIKGIDKPPYDNEGRIVWTQHQYFDLYNIYFPNGGSGGERHNFKQSFLKDLALHLSFEIKRGRDIVLVGDYNIAHLETDVYAPKALSTESGFLPEERQWFTEFLKMGFVDCFRHFYPEAKNVYSWWSYKDEARKKNNGWRIDYICVTPNLVKNLKTCQILFEQEGSDHCPVMVDLSF